MTFDVSLHEVCVRVCVRYVITKFSRMDSLPNLLNHGAPQARASRESSAIITGNTWIALAPRFASNYYYYYYYYYHHHYYYLLLLFMIMMMMMMILWVVNNLTSYFISVRICFQGGTLVATVVTLEKGLLWLVQAQLLLCATLADMVILTLCLWLF